MCEASAIVCIHVVVPPPWRCHVRDACRHLTWFMCVSPARKHSPNPLLFHFAPGHRRLCAYCAMKTDENEPQPRRRWEPFRGRRWADILSDEDSSMSYVASKSLALSAQGKESSRWKLGQLFRRETAPVQEAPTAGANDGTASNSPTARLRQKTQFPLGFASLMQLVAAGDQPPPAPLSDDERDSEDGNAKKPDTDSTECTRGLAGDSEPSAAVIGTRRPPEHAYTPMQLLRHGKAIWQPPRMRLISLRQRPLVTVSKGPLGWDETKSFRTSRYRLTPRREPALGWNEHSRSSFSRRPPVVYEEEHPPVIIFSGSRPVGRPSNIRFGSLDYKEASSPNKRRGSVPTVSVGTQADLLPPPSVPPPTRVRVDRPPQSNRTEDPSAHLKNLLGVTPAAATATAGAGRVRKASSGRKNTKATTAIHNDDGKKPAQSNTNRVIILSTTAHGNSASKKQPSATQADMAKNRSAGVGRGARHRVAPSASGPVSAEVVAYRLRQVAIEKSSDVYTRSRELVSDEAEGPPTPRCDTRVSAGEFHRLLRQWKCDVRAKCASVAIATQS